jgi:short chain dehydrogenase
LVVKVVVKPFLLLARGGRARMAGSLEGKVVLVTGGRSGICRVASLLLAKQGAKMMIADYAFEGAEKTVAMIKEAGGPASSLAAEVSVIRSRWWLPRRSKPTAASWRVQQRRHLKQDGNRYSHGF